MHAETDAPIRVLLADDHAMFRQGLAGVLASYAGMEVVAEVPNDEEALKLARDLSPDVVIMQVQMPFEKAMEALGAMRAFDEPPKVVIVTVFEDPHYVRTLTRMGASAYVLKTASAEHLVAAIRAAVLEILLLAARGLSNERIASSLHLSEATVKRHLANVYQKMGVHSRNEASREALLKQWITVEEVTAEDAV